MLVASAPVSAASCRVIDWGAVGGRQIYTEQDVLSFMETLPAGLADKVSVDVYLLDESRGNVRAWYEPGGSIFIYRNLGWYDTGMLPYLMYHELGHHIDELYGVTSGDWRSVIDADKGNYVSAYATTDHKEDFAESFAAYFLDRDWLQDIAPNRCRVIDELLAK